MTKLLDQYGRPIPTEAGIEAKQLAAMQLDALRQEIRNIRIKARWDASQTVTTNENHWSYADNLDPHGAASAQVRRTLRSRARYEVVENNAYLKGTVLTIANDFVGKGGPRLQITDKRIGKEAREKIESKWKEWFKLRKIRQKLWRAAIAKIVDGESFIRAYANTNGLKQYPIELDFEVLEADRVSSEHSLADNKAGGSLNEVDGVRFDNYQNPILYHILNQHPMNNGAWMQSSLVDPIKGQWVSAKYVLHWFRQDRGWLRGIPEVAPSLPLCSLLRRYTLAVVANAEISADTSGVIESELPLHMGATPNPPDDPFNTFPVARGLFMNLPYGYKLKQIESVPLGVQYDEFVGAILREITRPILAPFHISAGTSKDSNMASAVVDQHIYKGGQEFNRAGCEESVMDQMFELWWFEATRVPNYLGTGFNRTFNTNIPEHKWMWDRVGLDHTDPSKVAQAIQTLHDKRLITDKDYQETYMNRDVEEWREEITEDDEHRKTLEDSGMTVQPKQEERQAKQTEKMAKDKNASAEKIAKSKPKPKPAAKRKAKAKALRLVTA